ncbi:alpha/beta hydrolase fold protein [Deinococcus proteolyticus MRP]|uniref:Alpha/beta hydrolase fold protein n=1 Tax=Deinococcus proteolyticus (strain ATCC 35074 / DSM 20540 / JCM 6276 / NBRC 101906 / NCIMB 13154 / VKM Ac-1939 / CCM 2703 / MRP) TaxID=693977 RepID=F0RLU8_DEIPM|nr:alpha/beta hydrolase [Deinococcus proteolyticus]ADY26958.1 alpha/beta hydrolase fold protein [Deinococcus proteolyticus MRP]
MTNSQSTKPQTAVLLHAFPLDARMWTEQKKALEAAGLRVIVPHLPGFGGEAGELTSLEEMAETLVDNVLPEEPVALVGLSMGGYLALEVLAALQQRGQPERVSHLVLADTHAQGDDAEKSEDREKQAQKVLKEGQEFMVETAREEQKPSTAKQTAKMTREASREGVAAALRAMAARADRRDVLRRAGEQGVQVLALVGSEDALTPPEQAQENADLSGGQLKVIEGAGHLSNLDEPEAFNQALVDFLS